MKALAVVAALLAARAAAAEPLVFVRIDQTGGPSRNLLGTSYGLETQRPVTTVEGSSDRGTLRGVTHRVAAAYGIVDWLAQDKTCNNMGVCRI